MIATWIIVVLGTSNTLALTAREQVEDIERSHHDHTIFVISGADVVGMPGSPTMFTLPKSAGVSSGRRPTGLGRAESCTAVVVGPERGALDEAGVLAPGSHLFIAGYSVARLTFDNVPRYWSRRSTLCSSASITTSVNLVS